MTRWCLLACVLVMSTACDRASQPEENLYPWDIKLHADGSSEVFGLQLEVSTLNDAMQRYNPVPEMALFEKQGLLSLEAYFNEVRTGMLSGKMVVTLLVDRAMLEQFRNRAKSSKPMESGSLRYVLAGDDARQSRSIKIRSLTYIPYINLDDDIILQRFGEPEKRIEQNKTLVHYLYPLKGLDVIMDRDGKEVLQYVAPRSFDTIIMPLLQAGSPGN